MNEPMTVTASLTGFVKILTRARTRSLRTLAPWLLLASIAVALGWSFSREEMRRADASAMRIAGLSWVGIFFGLTTVLVAGFGVITSIEVVHRDTERGWLPPLFAAGYARWSYAPAVAATVMAEALLVYGVLVVCLLTPIRLIGFEPGVTPTDWLLGGGAFVVASTAYGLGIGILARKREVAVLLAVVLFLLPLAAVITPAVLTGEEVSVAMKHLAYIYIPFPSGDPDLVWRQLAYSLVVVSLAAVGAQRFLGRVS